MNGDDDSVFMDCCITGCIIIIIIIIKLVWHQLGEAGKSKEAKRTANEFLFSNASCVQCGVS